MQNIVNDKESNPRVGIALSGGQDSIASFFVLRAGQVAIHPIACDHQWTRPGKHHPSNSYLLRKTLFALTQSFSQSVSLHPTPFCEDGARQWRYTLLDRVSRKYGLDVMCTGHTASDVVENAPNMQTTDVASLSTRWRGGKNAGYTHPHVHRPTHVFTRWETKYLCLHYRLPCICDSSNTWASSRRTKQRIHVWPYQQLMQEIPPANKHY
jgi:tRNA(Ile)-lysidine synthase TilS/MesJ